MSDPFGIADNYHQQKDLQWIEGKVLSNEHCKQSNWKSFITKDKVCFDNHWEVSETVCHGDSGGPLVCDVDGKAVFLGVTSLKVALKDRGKELYWPCYVREGYPNIFTRIPYFLPWIKEHMVRHCKIGFKIPCINDTVFAGTNTPQFL